ncbi:MAG: hypothetical protein HYX69_19770 [Planctomycetia bacterium]|nr:hypothetical protein [Planctomycetia bacterium]
MRIMRYAAYLWPGLPDLWWRGAWSGLVLAVVFALVADFAVCATWVWDELLGPGRARTIGIACGAAWLTLTLVSLRRSSRGGEAVAGSESDLYPVALAEYLKGNWVEAEVLARQLLNNCPADVEAALLLAAVLRHTWRIDEARATLDELVCWDRAAGWQTEIDVEYQQLAQKERALEEEEKERKVHEIDPAGAALPNRRKAA